MPEHRGIFEAQRRSPFSQLFGQWTMREAIMAGQQDEPDLQYELLTSPMSFWGDDLQHSKVVFPAPGRRLTEQYFIAGQIAHQCEAQLPPTLLLRVKRDENLIASAVDLADLFSKINQLAFAPDEDLYGLVRPSQHAFKWCFSLLAGVVQRTGTIHTPSDVSADRNADIRISWRVGARFAELVCPSDEIEDPYIYHSSEKEFDVAEKVTAEQLSHWIRWATAAEHQNA